MTTYLAAHSFGTKTAPVIRTFNDGWAAFEWMCRMWARSEPCLSIIKKDDRGFKVGTVDIHSKDDVEVWHSKG